VTDIGESPVRGDADAKTVGGAVTAIVIGVAETVTWFASVTVRTTW
jgi:hypothetical protein